MSGFCVPVMLAPGAAATRGDAGNMRTLNTADPAELADLRRRSEFFWLDLEDPDPGTLEAVGEVLGLHELALEDTQKFGQRAKLDVYGEELLLVYFGATKDAQDVPLPIEVHVHISGDFVLTVHRDSCRQFDAVREVLRGRPPATEQLLVYRVIDALTDSALEVLDGVAAEVEEHETEVFRRPRARQRDRMAILRRALGALRRVLVVQRQVFDRLVERLVALPGLQQDVGSYYRDVADHLSRAIDETEAARDTLQGMLDTYTNEVQERLTIVATIFLPLTFVTGFFGQNFGWMVNHIGAAATFWGLGVGGMVTAVCVIVGWLVRSGLLQRRRP